jgi:hypothetical protein
MSEQQHLLSNSEVRHRRRGVAQSQQQWSSPPSTTTTCVTATSQQPQHHHAIPSPSAPQLSATVLAASRRVTMTADTELPSLYSLLFEPIYNMLCNLFGWAPSATLSAQAAARLEEFKAYTSHAYDATNTGHEQTLFEYVHTHTRGCIFTASC